MMGEVNWRLLAACQGTNDALFVTGATQNTAKRVCGGCEVRQECLTEALENKIEWGVWGGLTERERRVLLRKNPNGNWRKVFESA